MFIQRIKKGRKIKLKSLKNTNIGLNSNIEKCLSKAGIIEKDSANLNTTNNVLVNIDDFKFWCSYLDLEETDKGIHLTIDQLFDKLPQDSIKNKMNLCNKIYYDLKSNFAEDVSKKYNIDMDLIGEIFFLFS